MRHSCRTCERETEHVHLHDQAHGVSGTHMSGSERFVCKECGRTTTSADRGDFPFLLDVEANANG